MFCDLFFPKIWWSPNICIFPRIMVTLTAGCSCFPKQYLWDCIAESLGTTAGYKLPFLSQPGHAAEVYPIPASTGTEIRIKNWARVSFLGMHSNNHREPIGSVWKDKGKGIMLSSFSWPFSPWAFHCYCILTAKAVPANITLYDMASYSLLAAEFKGGF